MSPAGAPTVFYEETSSIDVDRLADEWGKFLDEQESRRWTGLRLDGDRRDYLAAHVLLRLALRERCGRDTRLPPPAARSGWSLTHCAGLVACAIGSEDIGIGVDAEPAAAVGRLHSMTDAFLSPGDEGWLASESDPRSIRLVELWTVKEAVLKARGEGITGPLGTAVLRALECTPTGTVDEWASIAVRDVRTDVRVIAWVRREGEHVLAVASLETHEDMPRLTRLPLQ